MKTIRQFILIAALATLPIAPAHAQKISRQTADWIRVNVAELRNQPHSVQVAYVDPGQIDGQVQWFHVLTSDNNVTSWIYAIVPVTESALFLERYGVRSRWVYNKGAQNKRLDAIVRVGSSGNPYLEAGDHSKLQSAASAPPIDGTKIRTWTDSQGRQIKAEYIRHDTTSVTLRRTDDGRAYSVAITQLCAEDQTWVLAQ